MIFYCPLEEGPISILLKQHFFAHFAILFPIMCEKISSLLQHFLRSKYSISTLSQNLVENNLEKVMS